MRGLVCSSQFLLALASTSILGSKFHGTRDLILLSQIPDFPNVENRSLLLLFPMEQDSYIHPELGSLCVASYNLRGYGGGILTCLHRE
jgi:hypothetical protein